MKKIYLRFLEISARLTGKSLEEKVKDGTLGLDEYIHLVANGLMSFFSLLIVAIIFGPIYFLVVRPYKWTKKKISDWANSIRVSVPR